MIQTFTTDEKTEHVWNDFTYRADVESLVDISKLALTYAASQLNTIPLNLIIPRYIYNEHRHGRRQRQTQGQTEDTSGLNTYRYFFLVSFYILLNLSESITAHRLNLTLI